ncbi:MAG: beta-ketoacyl synthase N-terminal-like domain-containing protein [Archangium sp.]|nr:beta-ketoacyl synthase N-terminal-like domain-containing protein [Archangium sp.]
MNNFQPIAIVGQSCTLPGAHTPEQLWTNVLAGKSALTPVPADRWGVPRANIMGTVAQSADRTWSDVGGYVTGFQFDATGTAIPADELRALDPLFQLTIHGVREALRSAKLEGTKKTGLVLGNLSFPSASQARYAESVWLGKTPRPHARNRFNSGLPAHLTARALGLGAGAFALDAACASSLYAIKLACDRLHDGTADVMVAGAVNQADDLFIHVGFCALSALSKTGQSRPFHKDADGLVPAEGAGFVVLERLSDARAKGHKILGVIRGVGLSNDGRGRGLLAPSEEGQERALRLAYEQAGLKPSDVSLLECHATGTPVGDATELKSMSRVFAGCSGVPIGSLKSNLGHLITAAGVAGLIKVLAAMEHGKKPPTLHVDQPNAAVEGTPFRLLREAEAWTGPKRAGISAFGFGGNNAHLIVESADLSPSPLEGGDGGLAPRGEDRVGVRGEVAIVGIGARVGQGDSASDFTRDLIAGTPSNAPRQTVAVALEGLKFPPNDLQQSLGQQTMVLEAAREAAHGVKLPRDRTSVLIGMGCDAEVSRYGARWRLASEGVDAAWLKTARDGIVPVLQSGGVVGTMPNIPANRINSQLDVAGPAFTVSSEEASGITALHLAVRALRAGEIDAALVGAVDLSHEPVHQAALKELGISAAPGDAAVVLTLKRLEDARRDGDPVFATVAPHPGPLPAAQGEGDRVAAIFGKAHAANGLLHVAAAALTLHHGLKPSRFAEVSVSVLEAERATVSLKGEEVIVPFIHKPRAAGPMLTLAAHAPTPRLPLPAQRGTANSRLEGKEGRGEGPTPAQETQVMIPAPHLEPVLRSSASSAPLVGPLPDPLPRGGEGATSLTSPPARLPAPPLPATQPLAAPTQVPFMNDTLSRFMAQQQQLATVHREFLAQQAAVHERFLALQQSAEAGLRQAYGVASQGPSTPVAMNVAPQLQPAPQRQLPAPPPPPAPVIAKPAAPPAPPAPAPVIAKPVAPPPAPAAPVIAAAPRPAVLPGPKFDRQQLEILAGGKISSVFGPQFENQDGYARQVRMPEPPLLLADRVTGIEGAPQSMGKGTIWTETDVRADSWYLDDEGRMPAGVMIESGQADLLLISWLGIDSLNKGERVYRLLGCDLTYRGGLPVPGETLQYDIHVDGHATQGDVRLFFFHYDCHVDGKPRLSVRNGQAGFFTDEELANSAGVLWDANEEKPAPAQVDAPFVQCEKRKLTSTELKAFASGKPFDCFGKGWETAQPHVRSPRITSEKMQFLHEVTELDPKGGPWGRGYLRAETPVTPDDWFFKGHFKNDPCMPGTLMFDGCLQAMSIYLASLGYTIERDAWRFEPVPDTKYPMRCRGQVTPTSKHLVYEVFVSEVSAGPIPTVWADLLVTVDGRKAFHAKRVGLRLVPDWPMEHWKHLGPVATQLTGEAVPLRSLSGMAGYVEPKPCATVDGFAFDYHSLLACAWGPPSKAFGPFYARFDGTRRAARLPGPPYHFMSRITKLDGALGGMKPGTAVEVEYDVPVEQWYFEQNGNPTMPFCVVMEAALQPCGWLASYVGSALTTETDMLFRNLDGTGTMHVEILPSSGIFKTKVKMLSLSQSAGMIIENFEVECFVGDTKVFDMKTVFGFFPKEAFENQVGLPVTPDERARLTAPAKTTIDLTTRPPKYCAAEPRLPGDMLLMLDRVIEFTPDGGPKNLGYLRAEKTVDTDEWFFKAHFFQDPVQPGSLGVEALCQLLQFFMLEKGMGEGIKNARFEPLMLEKPVTWKYRGQVVPKNKVITSEIQITEVGEDEKGRFAVCEGWLWVDGKRIYSTKNLGMRIVSGPEQTRATPPSKKEESLDPKQDTWLADHCPTWTLPALPMMSMVDRLAAALPLPAERGEGRGEGRTLTLTDVQVHRWLPFAGGAIRLKTEVEGDAVTLLAWRDAPNPALSRFEPVATGRVGYAPHPDPLPAAQGEGAAEPNPYASGALFHGPAFHYLTSLKFSATGSTAILRAENGKVPRGALNQGLLDAATHGIPHDDLSRWSSQIPSDVVGYPYRIKQLRVFSPLPDAGEVRVESRFAGFDGEPRFPIIDVQMIQGDRVLVDFRLVEVLLPRGPIGAAPREDRRRFLRDRAYVPGVALSSFDGRTTGLSAQVLRQSDWLPGNVACIYDVPAERRGDLVAEVAQKEHVSRRAFVHPSSVTVEAGGARAAVRPLRLHPLHVTRAGDDVLVADASPPVQDLTVVRSYWRKHFAVGEWPVEDLYYGLVERFVGDVVLADPAAFNAVQGRSCLYLANHQVGVESLLFSMLISALSKTPTVTLAKAEHRTSWLGTLIAHNFSYPGVVDPKVITFFDRDDKESLLRIVGELGAEMKHHGKSVMVHVEGTRSLQARQPVVKMSSTFIDMALAIGAPIIPVRLVGGLPVAPLETRLEFPVGFGRQDYWLGRPLLPEQLSKLPLKERKDVVLAAMNSLGPDLSTETPLPGDAQFGVAAEEWRARTGTTPEDAVLFTTLAGLRSPGVEVKALLEGARAGRMTLTSDPRSQWLGRLAKRLFGPNGPAVDGLL